MLIAVPCMHSISFFFTATQFLTLFSSSTILEHFSYVGRWSAEEHQVFILGMQQYPKEWKKIAAMVKTRTVVQIRTHAQKCWNDAMADPRKCKTSDVDTGAMFCVLLAPFRGLLRKNGLSGHLDQHAN